MKRILVLAVAVAVLGFGAATNAAQPGGLSTEEAIYNGRMLAYAELLTASLDRGAELGARMRLTDEGWRLDMVQNVALWPALYGEVRRLDPPPRFADSHAAITAALADYDRAAAELRPGIWDTDADAIARGTEYMERGDRGVQNASAELREIVDAAEDGDPEAADAKSDPRDVTAAQTRTP